MFRISLSSSEKHRKLFSDFFFCSLQLIFSEPLALGAATASEFEAEPVQGRKVSKVVKTTMVRGERTEKLKGDPSLATDLPSARDDFEKVSVSKVKPTLTGRVQMCL